MKRVFLLFLICIFSISLSACSSKKEEALQSMLAKQSDSYNIYVFWDQSIDYEALIMNILTVINSDEVLKAMNIENMTPISINDTSQLYKYSSIFNMKYYPTILIFNHKELVYRTTDPEDIYDFAASLKEK